MQKHQETHSQQQTRAVPHMEERIKQADSEEPTRNTQSKRRIALQILGNQLASIYNQQQPINEQTTVRQA